MASRTSVTSENITAAPARTRRSAAKPSAGLAVTPEKASEPPHCRPMTRSEAGQVSRRRALSTASRASAIAMMASTMAPNPSNASSCIRTTLLSVPSGSSRSGTSFSQPRPTTMTSPPKFGFSARFCSVRIGTIASGIDRNAAAVIVRQAYDVVYIRIFRQQFRLDALDRKLQRAGDALHAGRDRQHVLGADRAVRIAKPLERVTLQRRLRGRDGGGEFELIE